MIELVPTNDMDLITEILTEPEMFQRIGDDNCSVDDFDISNYNAIYMLCVNELDEVVGCFILEPSTTSCIEVHIQVKKKYRKEYAVQCGISLIRWFTQSPQILQKLVTQTPVVMLDVINFTKKFGFIEEGVNKLSMYKGGKLVDQIYFGLTKKAAIELFKEKLWQ